MAKIGLSQDELDNWQDFYTNDYVSSSQLAKSVRNGYPSRSGKVKRAPTLAELEGDDDYYSPDDTYFEDRRK